jgi:hypothetical protein
VGAGDLDVLFARAGRSGRAHILVGVTAGSENR